MLGFTLMLAAHFLLPRSHHDPTTSARVTWHLVVPRQGQFSVAQATAWFTGLQPLLARVGSTLSVELCSTGHELQLLLTAPDHLEETLRGQLAAWFPAARMEPIVVHAPGGFRAVEILRPQEAEILPIRIATDSAVDPLLGVIGTLTAAPMPCGLRLTCRHEPPGWSTWARQALHALEAGEEILPRRWPAWRRRLTELVRHAIAAPRRATEPMASPSALLGAADKAKAVVVEAHLTVWAENATDADARRLASRLAAQLVLGYRDPSANTLASVGPPRSAPVPSLIDTIAPCPESPSGWAVYSAAELASLFHLPDSGHPLISTEPARQVPPVAKLPAAVSAEPPSHVVLGEALTREGPQPFGLAVAERRLHLYVVGKTGTGKSTFLANLVRQDLEQGAGLALIDPHGDLAERVLSLVPRERGGDLLYFNAADTEYPVGFNLLAATSPAQRPLVASGVVGVFKKLYGESWGPRLEHFLRNAVLTLLETPSPSLLLLPRLLTDKAFRHQQLTYVRDPLLRTFFLQEYEQYDARWRAEAISPILNKVGQFLASPVARHIVGQRGSGFDLRQLMDNGGVFIANLASGRIGEDNCDLLGGLLVAGFQLAAMSRANQPEAERRDFQLLVDEFQHFANDAFSSILSEARKYRLSLTLSHQYLDQLPPEISEAVFGNAGSLCVFRVGAGDTTRLVRELAPSFDSQDLIHLPNYRFCARINRAGETVTPFSARSLPLLAEGAPIEPLIQGSRRRWARPRAEVELEIADLWEGRIDA